MNYFDIRQISSKQCQVWKVNFTLRHKLSKVGQPRLLFCLFSFFFKHKFYRKDFIAIRTQIVVLEGEHADHLTTTTALGTNYHLRI